jgi:hypothetical protein
VEQLAGLCLSDAFGIPWPGQSYEDKHSHSLGLEDISSRNKRTDAARILHFLETVTVQVCVCYVCVCYVCACVCVCVCVCLCVFM